MAHRNLFVNRESGAMCRVTHTDDSYAYLEVVDPPSKYAMPRREYDTVFVKLWRPASDEDVVRFEADYDLPANAPAGWLE